MSNNTFLTELFDWSNQNMIYRKIGDCRVTISEEGILKLEEDISPKTASQQSSNLTKTPQEYLNINIKDSGAMIISQHKNIERKMYQITSDNGKLLSLDIELIAGTKKFGLRFDSNSSSSLKIFCEKFEKMRQKKLAIKRYESSNLRFEGVFVGDTVTGQCMEYYDTPNHQVKYIGEMENGKYDGSGEFFSEDNMFRLICPNICKGTPNGKGQLIIGNRKPIVINMNEMKDLNSSYDKYLHNIVRRIEPDIDNLIEQIKFELLNNDAQMLYILKEIQKLRQQINSKPRGFFY